jgi:N6-adenosine-specific RNA methylase IME4
MTMLKKQAHPFGSLKLHQYGAILADPPIPFKTWSRKGEGRSPQSQYECMLPEAIAALPVADLAAPDCFLFSWVPLRSIDLVKPLMRAWGFTYSSDAFVWIKTNRTRPGLAWGTGYGTRKNAEICWFGRGKPKRLSAAVHEVIMSPRRPEHSRKPDEIYGLIEQLCAGPYVELFARQRWPGWDSWGLEVDKFKLEKPAKQAAE